MLYSVDETMQRRAKSPHELAMVNLLLFNLLIAVALLAGSMAAPGSDLSRFKWLGVGLPLLASLLVVLVTWIMANRRDLPWFVAAHWRLTARRYRILLVAYLVAGAVVSLAFIHATDDGELARRVAHLPPAMQEMERHKLESQDLGSAIWARLAVVPLLLTVMTLIMLESGALYQAGRGEVPDAQVARFPPPPESAAKVPETSPAPVVSD